MQYGHVIGLTIDTYKTAEEGKQFLQQQDTTLPSLLEDDTTSAQ